MESGESLVPPLSARRVQRAPHAEAKGVAARWVAIAGRAVRSGTTGRPCRWLRRDGRSGPGRRVLPGRARGTAPHPPGRCARGFPWAKGIIPDESRMPEIGTSGSTSGGRKRDYAGD